MVLGSPAAAQDVEPGLTWYVLPSASFDTDDGLGAGARAELAWLDVGYAPYRTALVLDAYAATSGYQQHRLRLDQVGIGRLGRGRVTVRLAWRQWLNDGYWGIGNGTARERAFVGPFDADDPDRKHYDYQLFQPYGYLTWRQRLQDEAGFELFLAVSPKFSRVEAYPGSLLEAEQPYGMVGGPAIQGIGGVLHDTRSPEVAPVRGHLAEISGRVAPRLAGEAGGFGGAMVSLRGYAAPTDRVVLAGRGMAEWLFGSVPFYEMVHWGGAFPVVGMGGYQTVRGLAFGRLHAPGKAVVNLEARVRVADLAWGSRSVGLELAPYVDAGWVWGAETPVPAALPVHPAFGLGGRVILDDTFVGRVDTGFGLDPVAEPDGRVVQVPTWGLYLVYDYAF